MKTFWYWLTQVHLEKWLLNTHIDEQLNWHEHINYVLQTI